MGAIASNDPSAWLELLGELGRGGAGTVYRARDRRTGRELAVKLLHVTRPNELQLERFLREGQIAAGLQHPGIVAVHAAGELGGRPFLAFELVRGARPLLEASDGLPLSERVGLVRDAARALGYAHRQGVVHRDVKPTNLLVDAEGRMRVADFGAASAQGLERITSPGSGTPWSTTSGSPRREATSRPCGGASSSCAAATWGRTPSRRAGGSSAQRVLATLRPCASWRSTSSGETRPTSPVRASTSRAPRSWTPKRP